MLSSEADIKRAKGYRRNWPGYARDVLRVRLDPAQEEILWSVQNNRRTAVKSGHARGKDFLAAVSSICFFHLNAPSKVISTAPTGRQVKGIMMSEIHRILQKARPGVPREGRSDGLVIPGHPDWFLLGFKAGDKATESWTGFHSRNVMVVVTEASGLPDETFNAIEGLLTGNSRLLLVMNPNRTTGEAYQAFRSPLYTKFTLSCLDAPNVKAGRTLIPGQVDRQWVDEHVHKAGWTTPIEPDQAAPDDGDFEWEGQWFRPSDLFRVKVLGMWPRDSEDQLVPLAWVEAAQNRWKDAADTGEAPLRLGVDVAGMGSDLTVFCRRLGSYVESFETFTQSDHMATAGRVRAELEAAEVAAGRQRNMPQKPNRNGPPQAFIDTIGEGAGVHSRLRELGVNSVSVKFSEGARGLKDLTGQRVFANMRAFCWWAIRDALDPQLDGQLALPPSDELAQDLTTPRWSVNSSGQIVIESKDDIRERLGRSPDYGDALANTFYPRHSAKPKERPLSGVGIFS